MSKQLFTFMYGAIADLYRRMLLFDSIYRKLEIANRTQAIIRAQELGLLHA